MPSKIETDSIVRAQENKRADDVQASNADYVTQLEETTSIMPPEKPFETEEKVAETDIQDQEVKEDILPKEETDHFSEDEFARQVESSTSDIEQLDQTNETKLFLLNSEHKKISLKLAQENLKDRDKATLETLINEVEDKIATYQSKLRAGATGSKSGFLDPDATTGSDGEGNEGEGGVLDGIQDQVIATVGGMLSGKKEEEEEEEKEETEREFD